MYLKIKKTSGIELNGNRMSGNTYPVKDWIKSYLGGRWDGNSKTWVVDTDKVHKLLSQGANIYIDNSQPQVTSQKRDNWKVWTPGGWELGEDY